MKKILGIILILGLAWNSAQAEIYRYKDDQGNPVYSDTPQQGAEPVYLPGISTFKPGKAPATANKPPEKKEFRYDSVNILKPEKDETFRDNTGTITVQAQVSPSLRGEHKLVFDLDGEQVTTTSSSHVFENVARGSHTVSVQVVDKDGNPVSSRASVQFYVHRYSKLLAPNRPKPPAKPPTN